MALPPKKEKPGAILAIALGAPKMKKGAKPMGSGMKRPMPKKPMPMGDSMLEDEEDPLALEEEDPMSAAMPDEDLSPEFVEAASDAFPELAADPMRLAALKQAILSVLS